MRGRLLVLLPMQLLLLSGCLGTSEQTSASSAVIAGKRLHISDLGDGTYRNPILHIDYSDPDVVAVGDNYYMTASSFNAAPGLPILHSTDLVNWTLINYALPRQVPLAHYNQPQHGNGVWAPNFRYHDGKFWIFYPDPDFGIYVVTSDDPAGIWSEPTLILPGKGIIDPTPLWDDNGKAYLLHAWAKSRAGFNNVLSLRDMAPDASWVSNEYTHIVDGHQLPGYRTLEGPKFYKRNGYYYIFAPAGGVETGWQAVFRATDITGPYEHRTVIAQGNTLVNGPHQGSWIHTPQGEDWFIHFQSRKAYGRITHLQPVSWQNDWPVIGRDNDNDGRGEPVYEYAKPLTAQPGTIKPQPASDEFNTHALSIQWQWNANPQPGWYALNDGRLTLQAAKKVTATGDNLWMTPNLLLQKLPAQTFQVRAKLQVPTQAAELESGLLLFGEDYAWVGVKSIDGAPHLVYVQCKNARTGCDESVHDYGKLAAESIELRYILASDSTAVFAYRYRADEPFTVVGEQFIARRGRWVGAKTGLFAVGSQKAAAHYDYFRVLPMHRERH
ncbi:glycoside hydrolase family 43 protein [Alteromonas gilva]|uniref:Glycoside hydrolase 43 family protein n=1 Tax=Alteromonas gilva TaxID=2987522 RepID=A0ABT5KXE1_9ALTE|nr:glycoside hydrolase 43 family protein [Alteromonas gilva]MDC8829443.1 glycoside hydrolase 43 family protein [Alteromonas gilva]